MKLILKIIRWLIGLFMQTKNITIGINGFLDGLNTKDNAFQLSKNELCESNNLRIDETGNAEKRTGNALINPTATANPNYTTNIFQYVDDWGNKTTYRICGTKLEYLVGTTWTEVADGLGKTKTLSNNKRASMFTWKDGLFISNGEEPAFQLANQDVYTNKYLFVSLATASNNVRLYNLDGTLKTQSTASDAWFSAIDAIEGRAYITRQTAGVNIYTADGVFLLTFGTSGQGLLENAKGIALDINRKKIYVADTTGKKIKIYDFGGNYLTEYSHATYTANLSGIAIDNKNNVLYICDTATDKIYMIDLSFTYIGEFGGSGTGNGQFAQPWGITIDQTNKKIYVVDKNNNRVQIFTLAGIYSAQFGSGGAGDGQFNAPYGITVNPADSLVYIADSGNNRIQSFNLAGTYSSKFSTTQSPYGISVTLNTTLATNIFHDLGSPLSLKATGSSICTGTHNGATNNTKLVDTTKNFVTTGVIAGMRAKNTTDGCIGVVTTITTTTNTNDTLNFSGGLSGGTENDFDSSDAYIVYSGSNPNGTYKYKITYGTATLESSGGIESNEVTVTAKGIQLTNIPISPISDVTRRLIYRTAASGTVYKFLATISNNTTTTYDDDIADASLGDVIPTVNNLVPTFKYLVEFKDTLWGAGDYNYPSYLYWTSGLDENDWEIFQFEPVGTDEGAYVTTGLTGLIPFGDYLIVFKEDAIWYVVPQTVDDIISISTHCITKEYGCISGFTADYATVKGQQGIIFADRDKGICFLAGGTVTELSSKISTDWTALNKLYLNNAYGRFYTPKNEYWLSLTASGTTNNQVWIFNAKTGVPYKPFTMNVCSFGKIIDSGIEYLYSGDFAGYVYKQDSTEADATAAIDGYFTTGWLHCGYPSNHKIFDQLIIDYIEKGAWNVTVYWATDGNSFTSGNSANISLAGTAGNRNKYILNLVDSVNQNTANGRNIRFRFRNTNASEPFEITGLNLEVRVQKARVP